ncbi:MAG TPA: nucleoside 2-deoxyribosyltransferase, partial [Solirubrobacterales bacterium]
GDVFAAGFAWAWAQEHMDPAQAARVGSHLASLWCGEQRWQPAPEDFSVPAGEFLPQDGRVYLAGPFFSLSQRWLVELVRESLLGLGGAVFSPLHDVGYGADEVADKDLDGLNSCTAMLALLDEIDAGVLFESGWARRSEIPVIVYTEHIDDDQLKMVRGSGAEICADLSSAVYRVLWASMGLKD